MAETNSPEKPSNPSPDAESPTTAQPLDFDDDQQETGTVTQDGKVVPDSQSPPPRTSSRNVRFEEEEAPPKPPRPMSPQQQAHATLIEAFPSIESNVIKAVLVASGGQVEPAFNALLSMSDPEYQEDGPPPPQPPRPQPPRTTALTPEEKQMQQDELYARQLAAHYENRARRDQQGRQQVIESRGVPEEREHSFFDDDLPEIKENLRQGFLTTQTKVNKWFTDFKKRMDGEESDEEPVPARGASSAQRQNFGPSQADQLRGIQKTAETQRNRRNIDREHYDADPQVISDNFQELELRDDDDTPPQKPPRPLANPDLFKPTPKAPQSGPVDEVEAMYRQPTPSTATPTGGLGKSQEWQSLTPMAPNPEEEDNDPFSLGDSDDDKDKDINPEASERLKQASLSKEDSRAEGGLQLMERSGSVGTKDKTAEELLTKNDGS